VARVALRERDGATEVELTQGPFATEARRELHKAGWIDTLARLASHVAPAERDSRCVFSGVVRFRADLWP
jgi:hypothetical protein